MVRLDFEIVFQADTTPRFLVRQRERCDLKRLRKAFDKKNAIGQWVDKLDVAEE